MTVTVKRFIIFSTLRLVGKSPQVSWKKMCPSIPAQASSSLQFLGGKKAQLFLKNIKDKQAHLHVFHT